MSATGSGRKHANALARTLAKITPKPRLSLVSRINARVPLPRVDVVSESLCDDVISYLAPTLEQHKGCTLIDLQPGACLFSSKLHEYLRPKRHLLIEPEEHYYKPFIKPLLDLPGSTYRYTQLDIIHQSSYWDEFQRIHRDPDLLPAPRDFLPDDPARRQYDSSTLMIGNLAREPRVRSKTHTVDWAPTFLYNMAYHTLANRFMHKGGVIRMLFWLPERYKPYLLSTLPWFRSGLQVSLDLAVNTSQVVSVEPLASLFQARSSSYKRRKDSALFEHIGNQEVAANMRELGMIKPDGRELEIPATEISNDFRDVKPLSPFRIDIKTSDSLRKIIDTTRERILTLTSVIRGPKRLENRPLVDSIEYPQVHFLLDEYSREEYEKQHVKVEWWRSKVLLDLALRIVHLEANFKALEDSGALDQESIDRLRNDVLTLDAEFTALEERAPLRVHFAFQAFFEDQIAFFLSPRLVNFPSRSYEPIKAQSSDFYPQQNLALFDFVPKTRDISVPGLATGEECARFCAQLVSMLFHSRGQSLPQALDKIGVNAAKDLIPMVPEITDARKGGRLNPNHVRVRMITEEMIVGLVKAFFEWPFRPRSWELAMDDVSRGGHDETEITKESPDVEEESLERHAEEGK